MKSRIGEFERSALLLCFAKNYMLAAIVVLAANIIAACSGDDSLAPNSTPNGGGMDSRFIQ